MSLEITKTRYYINPETKEKIELSRDFERFPKAKQEEIQAEKQKIDEHISCEKKGICECTKQELAQEKLTSNEVTYDSGLKIRTLQEGSGESPTISDIVNVNYELKLLNGKIVTNRSSSFPIN